MGVEKRKSSQELLDWLKSIKKLVNIEEVEEETAREVYCNGREWGRVLQERRAMGAMTEKTQTAPPQL